MTGPHPTAGARHRWSLRERATAGFALGGLLLSSIFAGVTYVTAREYLVQQRERSAQRQAFADASFVREGLLGGDEPLHRLLDRLTPSPGALILVRADGHWFGTDAAVTSQDLPTSLLRTVAAGQPALAWTRQGDRPALAVGTPLPAVDVEFYELAAVNELGGTLTRLRTLLLLVTAIVAAMAALLGRLAAARVLRPLTEVARTARALRGGDLDARMAPTPDPDLAPLADAVNQMAASLQERMERERRFAADVSHELRSPLATLVAATGVLEGRRAELSTSGQQALDLVATRLDRFRRVVQDLLALARLDAGATEAREPTDLVALLRHTLSEAGRPTDLLHPPAGEVLVEAAKPQLERALVNLVENADLHGGGLVAVTVEADGGTARVLVDDAGPGVPPGRQEQVFDRFARGGPRGSAEGTGLGLSLVRETLRAHGGGARCVDRPGGGARFVLELPLIASSGDRLSGTERAG